MVLKRPKFLEGPKFLDRITKEEAARRRLLDRISRLNKEDAARRRLLEEQQRRGLEPVTERELRPQTTIPTPTVEDLTRGGIPQAEAERIVKGLPAAPTALEPVIKAEAQRVEDVQERQTFLNENVVVGKGEYVAKKDFEKLEPADQTTLKAIGVEAFVKKVTAEERDREIALEKVERFEGKDGYYLLAALTEGTPASILVKAGFNKIDVQNATEQWAARQRLKRDFGYGVDGKDDYELLAALMAGAPASILVKAGFNKIDVQNATEQWAAQQRLKRDFGYGEDGIYLVQAVKVGLTDAEVAKAIEKAGFSERDLAQARTLAMQPEAPRQGHREAAPVAPQTPRQALEELKAEGVVPEGHVFVGTTAAGEILSLSKAQYDALPAKLKDIIRQTEQGNPLAFLNTEGMSPEAKDKRYKYLGAIHANALMVATDENGEPLYLPDGKGGFLKSSPELEKFVEIRNYVLEHPETGLEAALRKLMPDVKRRGFRGPFTGSGDDEKREEEYFKLVKAAGEAGLISKDEAFFIRAGGSLTGAGTVFGALAGASIMGAIGLPLITAYFGSVTAATFSQMSTTERAVSIGVLGLLFVPMIGSAAIRSFAARARDVAAKPAPAAWVQSVKAGNIIALKEAPSAIRATLKTTLDSRLRLAKAYEEVRALEAGLQIAKGEVRTNVQGMLATSRQRLAAAKRTFKQDVGELVRAMEQKGVKGGTGEMPFQVRQTRIRYDRLREEGLLPQGTTFKVFQRNEAARAIYKDTLQIFGEATQAKLIPVAKIVSRFKRIQNEMISVADKARYPATLTKAQARNRLQYLQRQLVKEGSRLTVAAYKQGNALADALGKARAYLKTAQGSADVAAAKVRVAALENALRNVATQWKQYTYRPSLESPAHFTPGASRGRSILDLKPTRPRNPVKAPGAKTGTIIRGRVSGGARNKVQPARVAVLPLEAIGKTAAATEEAQAGTVRTAFPSTPSTRPAPTGPATTPVTTPRTRPAPAGPATTPVPLPSSPTTQPTSPVSPLPTWTQPRPGDKHKPTTATPKFQPSSRNLVKPVVALVTVPTPVPTPTPTPTPIPATQTRPVRQKVNIKTDFLKVGRPSLQRPLRPGRGVPPFLPFLLPSGQPLRKGDYPRRIQWTQGVTIVTRDLFTGRTQWRENTGDKSKTPAETLVVVSIAKRRPRSQRLDLGAVDIIIDGDRLKFVRSNDTGPKLHAKRVRSRFKLRNK